MIDPFSPDNHAVLHMFVMVVSLGTLTATNSVPPWESPCGKTTVQSALLDILGPVPKPTVSVKRMLHNVIIELKETDEKIATIQQYYVSVFYSNITVNTWFYVMYILAGFV